VQRECQFYLGQGDATVTSLQQTTASRWTKVSGC